MTREDVERVYALQAEVEVTPWSVASLTDAVGPGYEALVAEREGVVAGWLIWRTILDESELLLIGTGKAFQRQGVASDLMAAYVERLRSAGVALVHLEVRETNAPAVALYRKFGFVDAGLRKDYYFHHGRHENALLMTLHLNEEDACSTP